MKKIAPYLFYALLFVSSPHVWASEIGLHDGTHTDYQAWQNIDFWAGAVSGLLLHELGHVVIGMTYGGKPQLNQGSIVYPNNAFSRKASMRVSSAGFQAQWLLSELSFSALKKHDGMFSSAYYQGAIAMHLAISTVYLIRLKDMPTSDIYAASKASNISREQLAWAVFLPAALDAYRLMGQDVPDWVSHLSVGIKLAEVGYIWQF
ncbi:MAG: hypothetical protein Q9M11_04220 [Mariprofundaceae bacterium]|nr:hypothetical protein [Mariprofundaceae bacterium]